MPSPQFIQDVLFPYAVVYLVLVFILPSYRVYRATGKNPYVFGRSDSAHDYAGQQMRIMTIVTLMGIAVWSYFHDWYNVLVPLRWLETETGSATGAVLLVMSLTWIIIAQIHMGLSWRIGFKNDDETVLVRTGVFRFSRNPVFLGMIVTQLGVFLVMPNVVMLILLFQTYQLLQIQVRLEEEFLSSKYPQDYAEYRQLTRRWL